MSSKLRISVATVFALLSALALFAPSAMADENDNGCKDPGLISGTSNIVEAEVLSSGEESTYVFRSADQGGDKGVPGLISYCVFPGEQPDAGGVTVNESPGTGAQGWDLTFFNDPPTFSSFSFNRDSGNESNIPLDGTERTMGKAKWSGGAPAAADQAVTLHINDQAECEALGEASETCWVLPGEIEEEEEPPAADLEATKTAEPSFEREYEWTLEKNADKSKVEMAEGESVEVHYTVTVEHSEGTDSGWKVTGEITVLNPNSGAVNGVEVEDAIYKGVGEVDNNAECEVEEGTGGVEIEAGATRTFDYTCIYTGAPENRTEETNSGGSRQADVDQADLRSFAKRRLDPVLGGAGFGDYVEAAALEDRPDRGSHQAHVLDQHHAEALDHFPSAGA